MIFGKQTKRHDFGAFTSQQCAACQSSRSFRFACVTHYIVVFFLNLIPFSEKYETVCEQCGDTQALSAGAGRSVAKEFFADSYNKLFSVHALKAAAVLAVIAAAVILPLTLARPAVSPEILKGLVSEDGVYHIQNSGGDTLGIIEVAEGKKLLIHYNEISVLVGEPGSNAGFNRHEYYNEAGAGDTTLVRTPTAGVLKDRHGTDVRQYYYIKFADALGYSKGVEDLSAISYAPDKAVYPFSYYLDNPDGPTPFTLVLYFPAGKKIEAVFVTTLSGGEELTALLVSDYRGGRVLSTTQYALDPAATGSAQQFGLSPQSNADDVLLFIEQFAQESATKTLTYYKNTQVVSSAAWTWQDNAGEEQNFTQAYDVTENGGFYILKEME